MHYYLDQNNKYTTSTVAFTALMSVLFMLRPQTLVGWVPLLALKVFKEGSLVPFIMSAITVALPIIFVSVWLDTKYFQSDTWVLTPFNFFEKNLVHGFSKYFGVDPFWFYIFKGGPAIFTVVYPVAIYSIIYSHIKSQRGLG